MIEGVSVLPLKQIFDERGKVMRMLRSDDPHFQSFGEIYFSCVHPGAIKAWHHHSRMALNYAVPHGLIKMVLYDDRKDSPTHGEIQELFLGPDNYQLVIVPPFVWNGFKGLGNQMSIVANCATIGHDPGEITRADPFGPLVDYDWGIRHG